jgi:hypothetical protein
MTEEAGPFVRLSVFIATLGEVTGSQGLPCTRPPVMAEARRGASEISCGTDQAAPMS